MHNCCLRFQGTRGQLLPLRGHGFREPHPHQGPDLLRCLRPGRSHGAILHGERITPTCFALLCVGLIRGALLCFALRRFALLFGTPCCLHRPVLLLRCRTRLNSSADVRLNSPRLFPNRLADSSCSLVPSSYPCLRLLRPLLVRRGAARPCRARIWKRSTSSGRPGRLRRVSSCTAPCATSG